MKFARFSLFLFIAISLILSAFFSLKSLTGYLISDISDSTGNYISFLFLIIGLAGTWLYISKYRNK